MDLDHTNTSSQSASHGSGALWVLLLCSAAAIAVAIAMCAGLLARQIPMWLVVAAGLAVFPFLPLVWHGLAEVANKDRSATFLSGKSRFALRTLAIALVVLGVSLADLGPKQVVRNLSELAGRVRGTFGKPAPTPLPQTKAAASHGLESFIPADATLAVGLAGSAAIDKLLAAHGMDTREKLAALATCKIDFTNARVLLAARGREAQMIVVRAPGITDERNLYCLVGVMGPNRLQIRADGTGDGRTLQVSGFLARTLAFRLLDQTTVVAIDETWRNTADQRLFSTDATAVQGRLAPPLLRVDRTAPLWVARVDETPEGAWDLALDARQDGSDFKLQGSATPPSGEADRATVSARVPLAFVRALPESAVALGIRGAVAAVLSAGIEQSPPQAAPAAPAAAKTSTGANAR